MKTKQFPMRVVLTVTTGRLLTVSKNKGNGIEDLYEILNWMTSDDLFTHQLPRASEECEPWLFRWFPELIGVNGKLSELDKAIGKHGPGLGIKKWLASLSDVKANYDIPKIPRDDHEYKHPLEELIDMRRGNSDGIVVVKIEDEKP